MTTGKIIVSAVTGAVVSVAVGALLGVLFAPAKGTETRKKISQKSAETIHDLKQNFESLLGSIVEKFEEEEDAVANLLGKVKSKVEDFRKDGKVEVK